MSGICGILRLDGSPPSGLEAMAAHLARRGPEGTRLWRDGPVALGHTRLATTPEALRETLPLADPTTGCVVTADVRLDNREELLRALGLTGPERGMGDGELLLRAYLAWGEASVERLLGDWAFAIWDPRRGTIFAARDQMGMRQLAYAHLEGRALAFATSPRAVIEAADIPRRVNAGRVADFLEDYLESLDLTSTFFEGVHRLPPGHCLTVGPGSLRLSRYWTLDPEPELRLESDGAYAEAFLEVFTEAVRCRLRSAGPVGSMLSGGMDSGSVAAVAARLLQGEGRGPLPTFSVVNPDPAACVETRAIHAASGMPNLAPHLIDLTDLGPLHEDLLRLLPGIEEPFDGRMDILRAVYVTARRAGVRVVLDGGAGDVVMARPTHTAWLLRQGRWREAWREARGEEAFFAGGSRWRFLREDAARAFAPGALRRWRRRRADRRLDATGWPQALPGLAAQAGLQARRDAFRSRHAVRFRSPLEEQRASILSPENIAGHERYDRVAGACGVEARDPFNDLRVIRFAMRLPLRQQQENGWRKILLRRAMDGLLPDEVRWRRGKEHLGADLSTELLAGSECAPLAGGLSPLGDRLAARPGAAGGVPQLSHSRINQLIHPALQLYLCYWLEGSGALGTGGSCLLASWAALAE